MTDCVLKTKKGVLHKCRIEVHPTSGRLLFARSPFGMKTEIKAMAGAKWDAERKQWSVSSNPRNMFQLKVMMVEPINENPYEHFERPLELIKDIQRPLKEQQIDMVSRALMYRYQILAAEMGLGKSLTAIEIMERLAKLYIWDADLQDKVWFVGPRSALESVELDMYKWGVELKPRLMTYERLRMDYQNLTPPQVLICDECSGLKTPSALQTRAAQSIADQIREQHGTDGCVILMSGTVTAKRPSDIWAQAEIVWPGFLREGSLQSFENRYAEIEFIEDSDGVKFPKLVGWREKEVERLPARLDGLMNVYRREDYLKLPPRTFHSEDCPPSPRIKRVAKALADSSETAIVALTRLRALSSGFQYDFEGEAGENGERAMVETKCPKDDMLRKYLGEEETRGRTICFASFQGSIDRVNRICQSEGWDTIRIDGRGWSCYRADGTRVDQHFLDFWSTNPNKTVFTGNPASCRFGLTLVEAKTIIVFDSSFSAEHRLQSLDRNYRIGQDEPVRVIDLIHLPVDTLILDTLKNNRKLEELSLGVIKEALE